jgi:type I restriction enzyme R subunit
MDKRSLSEQDICSKYITPAIVQAGRNLQIQIREQYSFTKGRIKVQGKTIARGEVKRVDYILYYNNSIPLAIIEAKDNTHALWAGMQQGLWYASSLDIPFVYSSNGDGFLEHDKTVTNGIIEKELQLNQFPSPQELYQRYCQWKWIDMIKEQIINAPYYDDGSNKRPRYYQELAINKTIEAVANDQKRILLVMATGTGKTYTAFQIIRRLWKSKAKKRILFLADRNILVDQTISNDFKPFGSVMTKITNRSIDKSYEIYLSLYQAVTGNEEEANIYKQFSPEFFDLIIIDECHRGSANEESPWRDILDYFSSATQIGLTATPKETANISTFTYFWDPIYTYSLKQGIEDGFLAPYKVIKVGLNVDDERRPYKGQLDFYGNEIPDRIYNIKDYDKTGGIIIKERTEQIALKITNFLKSTDRMSKTIVFCVDIEHAERMRQALVNANADMVAKNRKYVMKITWDDQEGKNELDNFIDPKEPYPVIVTTSKLLTTGVDAKTCKVIALDQNINSMTEFKQIIGRGTRVDEDYGKYYFTILDFRKATNNFADPAFDGMPVVVYNPKADDDVTAPITDDSWDLMSDEDNQITPTDTPIDITITEEDDGPKKIYVSGVQVTISHERVQYIWPDGKLITESLKDYSKKIILDNYRSLDERISNRQHEDKKQVIIDQLESQGILLHELQEQLGKQELDPFDLICQLAYDQPALTRKQRASQAKKSVIRGKYGEEAKQVINYLLDMYADQWVTEIQNTKILEINPINQLGTPVEIINSLFGGKEIYMRMLEEMINELYQVNK